ncbi:hypothetical protein O6P43_020411 [Quillaja saponaria]|uniref:Uncharacterized protein n=1 Tax=Quillaja saponaria TaxID=32244 RepID=A0AAD7PLE1_QUISA|nr:hypothetical protein O6P43_020411 [Quillaja saponaria]
MLLALSATKRMATHPPRGVSFSIIFLCGGAMRAILQLVDLSSSPKNSLPSVQIASIIKLRRGDGREVHGQDFTYTLLVDLHYGISCGSTKETLFMEAAKRVPFCALHQELLGCVN